MCLTENTTGLDRNIKTIPLPQMNVHGWWYKPYVFSQDLCLTGQILFLDLDIVIHSNIDRLWEYKPESFVIIRDFTRHMTPSWKKFNSSVFRFSPSKYHWLWENFENNYKNITSKNFGDQDYLYNMLNQQTEFWPDEWIMSYKWEIRDKNDLTLINGKRNFNTIKTPVIPVNNCITVFHGDPNPHAVRDPWVIENWK